MSESHSKSGDRSSNRAEHSGAFGTSVHDRIGRRVKRHLRAFGRAVCAIWPIKPALHLAQLEGCTERSAQYQIDGERKVTARAMHAVEGKMLD